MTSPASPRILAIGVAEATWDLIRDPSFAASVPFLRQMEREGARGVTLATQPLVPEQMWATIATGRSPGGHGIFESTCRVGEWSRRPVTAGDLRVPAIWHMLEAAGRPVGTFNVGLVDGTASGFMIGRDATGKISPDLVHPPELFRDLQQRFGTWTTQAMAQTGSEWRSLVPGEIAHRTDVFIDLLRTRPWRFALARFFEVGVAQHRFWGDESDTLRSIYTAVDRALARIVASVGPDTIVFVFSDCGAGPVRHAIRLNKWLEREGYLRRRSGLRQQAGLALARVHARARGFLPKSFDLTRFKMRVRASISASAVDWSHARAFSPGDSSEIVFNVPDGERDALAAELRAGLLALRDPEGRRVVEQVILRQEWGTQDAAPDLMIVWDDDAYVPVESFDASGDVFGEWRSDVAGAPYTGTHRREGIFLARGPGIGPTDLGRIRLIDLAPTWLALAGVGIPDELEGTSFADRLSPRMA